MPSHETSIHPLLRSRWSTRLFDPGHELADAELAQLLEAARWSPSAGNSQPWSFLVARRGETAHQSVVSTLSRGNLAWVPSASAVLVALHRSGREDDPTTPASEHAAYDLGQAVAHLTVQACSMGLAVHQFAGFERDEAARLLAVPPSWTVTTGVAVGRWADPALFAADEELLEKEQRPRVRKDLGEFVFTGQFGQPLALGAGSALAERLTR